MSSVTRSGFTCGINNLFNFAPINCVLTSGWFHAAVPLRELSRMGLSRFEMLFCLNQGDDAYFRACRGNKGICRLKLWPLAGRFGGELVCISWCENAHFFPLGRHYSNFWKVRISANRISMTILIVQHV